MMKSEPLLFLSVTSRTPLMLLSLGDDPESCQRLLRRRGILQSSKKIVVDANVGSLLPNTMGGEQSAKAVLRK
jgi:hypothetical protein